jgi:hypothetical protein
MERGPPEVNALRKPSSIVVTLCAALLLVCTGAWAEIVDNPPRTVEGQGELSRGVEHWRLTHDRTVDWQTPVPLPVPGKEPMPVTSGTPGPVAADNFSARGTAGMSMITPRGGAISSPRQQAEREIRRLIRHLD